VDARLGSYETCLDLFLYSLISMKSLALAAGFALVVIGACSSSSDDVPGQPQDAATPESSAPDAGGEAEGDAGAKEDAAALLEAGAPVPTCTVVTAGFPATVAVKEASSITEVELTAGKRELLIFGDSGSSGAGVALDIGSGAVRNITLPLDTNVSDDIEGIAWSGGKLYAITSSGAMQRFTPNGAGGLVRDGDAYAIGPAPTLSCGNLSNTNCGPNYESLCLRTDPSGHACVGYAGSKSDGKLYCLTIDNGTGRLVASATTRAIETNLGNQRLSDCAFGAGPGPAAGALVLATNIFGANKIYRVAGGGVLVELPAPTPALTNIEAITVDRDGTLYVVEDNDSSNPSAIRKSTCTGW